MVSLFKKKLKAIAQLSPRRFCSTVNAVLLGSISLISVFIREDYKADVFKTFPPLAEHMLCLFVAYSVKSGCEKGREGKRTSQTFVKIS